ncbi:MAG TPA: YfiR family protein [Tepidisphaeraceae bacterium]|jgi:hypothetical protein|nr:YfiR family protein [Tepidisphaeraceae bacterium]
MKHLTPRFLAIFAAVFLCFLLVPPRAWAEEAGEYQIKAAFIYNFVQFTDWPASAFSSQDEPILLAVVGPDPFHGGLERAVKDKLIGGRSVAVRHFANPDSVDKCHVIFIPAAENGGRAALNRLAGKSVLTIGDGEDFTRAGGVIRFYREKNRIRFEINVKAADRGKLKISAKLLKLATIYEE